MFELVSVRIVSLLFLTHSLVGFVAIILVLVRQYISYPMIFKTVPLAIISTTVIEK